MPKGKGKTEGAEATVTDIQTAEQKAEAEEQERLRKEAEEAAAELQRKADEVKANLADIKVREPNIGDLFDLVGIFAEAGLDYRIIDMIDAKNYGAAGTLFVAHVFATERTRTDLQEFLADLCEIPGIQRGPDPTGEALESAHDFKMRKAQAFRNLDLQELYTISTAIQKTKNLDAFLVLLRNMLPSATTAQGAGQPATQPAPVR